MATNPDFAFLRDPPTCGHARHVEGCEICREHLLKIDKMQRGTASEKIQPPKCGHAAMQDGCMECLEHAVVVDAMQKHERGKPDAPLHQVPEGSAAGSADVIRAAALKALDVSDAALTAAKSQLSTGSTAGSVEAAVKLVGIADQSSRVAELLDRLMDKVLAR